MMRGRLVWTYRIITTTIIAFSKLRSSHGFYPHDGPLYYRRIVAANNKNKGLCHAGGSSSSRVATTVESVATSRILMEIVLPNDQLVQSSSPFPSVLLNDDDDDDDTVNPNNNNNNSSRQKGQSWLLSRLLRHHSIRRRRRRPPGDDTSSSVAFRIVPAGLSPGSLSGPGALILVDLTGIGVVPEDGVSASASSVHDSPVRNEHRDNNGLPRGWQNAVLELSDHVETISSRGAENTPNKHHQSDVTTNLYHQCNHIWIATMPYRRSDLVWMINSNAMMLSSDDDAGEQQQLQQLYETSTVVVVVSSHDASSLLGKPLSKVLTYGKHAVSISNILKAAQEEDNNIPVLVQVMETYKDLKLQLEQMGNEHQKGTHDTNKKTKGQELPVSASSTSRTINVPHLGMQFLMSTTPTSSFVPQHRKKQVLVIGGGIIGSSIALNLARQQQADVQVTVVDDQSSSSTGRTTPASWAWINANAKQPYHYQLLNQLGMEAWKRDPLLRGLVDWKGSLVQYKSEPLLPLAGYDFESVQDVKQLSQLEPYAQLDLQDGPLYFFPNEGAVDPEEAVLAMRHEAERLGVEFLTNCNVANFVTSQEDGGQVVGVDVVIGGNNESSADDDGAEEEDEGPAVGVDVWGSSSFGTNAEKRSHVDWVDVVVKYLPTPSSSSQTDDGRQSSGEQKKRIHANVVVVAAGVGSADLVGLPMRQSPGKIVFSKRSSHAPGLERILVNVARNSHVLERDGDDGSMLVVGGGKLDFGGTTSHGAVLQSTGSYTAPTNNDSPLQAAESMIPAVLDGARYSHTSVAHRPIPQDGLPAFGYLERPPSGVYVAVTHSGVTLAPLLGAVAAAEIAAGVKLQLVEPFRPLRFYSADRK